MKALVKSLNWIYLLPSTFWAIWTICWMVWSKYLDDAILLFSGL